MLVGKIRNGLKRGFVKHRLNCVFCSMVLTEQLGEFHTTIEEITPLLTTKQAPLKVLFVRQKARRDFLQ